VNIVQICPSASTAVLQQFATSALFPIIQIRWARALNVLLTADLAPPAPYATAAKTDTTFQVTSALPVPQTASPVQQQAFALTASLAIFYQLRTSASPATQSVKLAALLQLTAFLVISAIISVEAPVPLALQTVRPAFPLLIVSPATLAITIVLVLVSPVLLPFPIVRSAALQLASNVPADTT
jgi:hypothetical protein